MANQPFHSPDELTECFDIALSQVNKSFSIAIPDPYVASASAKAVATHNNRIIQEYTVDDGLALSDGGSTVTFTISGSDFAGYATPDSNHTVKVWLSLINPGDVEITFDLQIIYSPL